MRRVDPKLYTRDYYLSDETGYREFKKGFGKSLEPRLERIVKEIPIRKGIKVLDIGCGRGELVIWFARNGASEVVGIDYSKSAVEIAKGARNKFSKKVRSRMNFKLMDAKNLKFKNNYFDLVVMTEILEHVYPDEQVKIFSDIGRVLKEDGFVFFHTAPSKTFNDFTYKYWCYPVSSILVELNNLLSGNKYPNLPKPNKIRSDYQHIMHVNEPDYISLRKLVKKSGFIGKIRSTNITIAKPINSWKDRVYNLLVFLVPISNYFPFNIFWGNDFYAVLKKDYENTTDHAD
jgi:ubiquinone/menaquinone biosynthesis C-methylase UbiE